MSISSFKSNDIVDEHLRCCILNLKHLRFRGKHSIWLVLVQDHLALRFRPKIMSLRSVLWQELFGQFFNVRICNPLLCFARLLVLHVTCNFNHATVDYDTKNLNHNHCCSKPKEFLSHLTCKESNVDQLYKDDIEVRQRNYFFPDNSCATEFWVIYEAHIVFIHIVLEQEEANCENRNIRNKSSKHQSTGESGKSIRKVEPKVICVGVHKFCLVWLIRLLNIVP